jgi:hypothetical protein
VVTRDLAVAILLVERLRGEIFLVGRARVYHLA